ncbi:MAG: IS110 family transposase [Alphaproteobacteria bacterium]|nr:IS110 family transposase [Alphaproteobacteria bacterium]
MSRKANQRLEVKYPDAAGIDIGSSVHYICVPEGRDEQSVKKFGCFTADLYEAAKWLKKCRIKTIVMESTGVYWIPLFQVLEKESFDVKLVNARFVKNVPGRKSDVQDCQWLQQLHSYGLLQGSFRPEQQICILRSYIRQRDTLTRSATIHVQRMQKALTQMNLQLHKVITDITGVTGMRILQAILSGERNPLKLAALRDKRTKNKEDTISKALEGDYREEHLFTLKQEFELYNIYRKKIEECDLQISNTYKKLDTKTEFDTLQASISTLKKKKDVDKDKATFDLRRELHRITGGDLTTIPGINTLSAQAIISEVGVDPSCWPTEKHFTSWLGLSPANKITGEKVFSTRTRKVNNRASTAFRMAALAVSRTETALGSFFRRIKNRHGAPKAITATARKIACIFYRMLQYGQDYVELGMEIYERRYKERVEASFRKKAAELGFDLVPLQKTSLIAKEVS